MQDVLGPLSHVLRDCPVQADDKEGAVDVLQDLPVLYALRLERLAVVRPQVPVLHRQDPHPRGDQLPLLRGRGPFLGRVKDRLELPSQLLKRKNGTPVWLHHIHAKEEAVAKHDNVPRVGRIPQAVAAVRWDPRRAQEPPQLAHAKGPPGLALAHPIHQLALKFEGADQELCDPQGLRVGLERVAVVCKGVPHVDVHGDGGAQLEVHVVPVLFHIAVRVPLMLVVFNQLLLQQRSLVLPEILNRFEVRLQLDRVYQWPEGSNVPVEGRVEVGDGDAGDVLVVVVVQLLEDIERLRPLPPRKEAPPRRGEHGAGCSVYAGRLAAEPDPGAQLRRRNGG
mmetsp:Transcript_20811/g.52360  ORF Transcript_20811/g.52360 Transcript_20811/m.52360 type:complete len:337 (-) Transcript_20811:90-1100(-)